MAVVVVPWQSMQGKKCSHLDKFEGGLVELNVNFVVEKLFDKDTTVSKEVKFEMTQGLIF